MATSKRRAETQERKRLKALARAAFEAHPVYAELATKTLIVSDPVEREGRRFVSIILKRSPGSLLNLVARVWLAPDDRATVELSPWTTTLASSL